MNLQSSIPHAGLFVIIILALAVATAYVVYFFRNDGSEFVRWQRALFSGLRGVSVFLTTLLLLSILVEVVSRHKEKPLLVIGVDNSMSMTIGHPDKKAKIDGVLTSLVGDLNGRYEVALLKFGNEVTSTSDFSYTDKVSDYNGFFEAVQNNYYNLNVGAAIVIGDGIYNKGRNPVNVADKLKMPVYTIGIGDTTIVSDQYLTEVTHNNTVFKGNSFPLDVEMNFREFQHDSTRIEIMFGKKKVISEAIRVPQYNWYLSKHYNIVADEAGLFPVTVQMVPVANEPNVQNNTYRFSIEVHENKQKVLMLTQSPHPDLGAFTEALKKHANFDIVTAMVGNFKGNVGDYDLVVLNQLPAANNQQLPVLKEINDKKIATLFVIGPGSSLSSFNNLGLGLSVVPTLTTQECLPFFNSSFSLFSAPDELKTISESYPPLLAFYSKYTVDPAYSVLAYQKINGIVMDYPLVVAGEKDGRKIGAIYGEGIWRWRIHEFQNFENSNYFNSLVANLFTYLCTKETRDQFRINYKTIVDETTPVRINAQVLDDIYQPVPNAEIKLMMKLPDGSEMTYTFDHNVQDYTLDLGFLNPGEYSFSASTKVGEKQFEKIGQFSVQEIQLEQQNLKADFGLLKQISSVTGGTFFQVEKSGQLVPLLSNNKNIREKEHVSKTVHEIIESKWLFLLIFFLLSVEWFLRKFWGSY